MPNQRERRQLLKAGHPRRVQYQARREAALHFGLAVCLCPLRRTLIRKSAPATPYRRGSATVGQRAAAAGAELLSGRRTTRAARAHPRRGHAQGRALRGSPDHEHDGGGDRAAERVGGNAVRELPAVKRAAHQVIYGARGPRNGASWPARLKLKTSWSSSRGCIRL